MPCWRNMSGLHSYIIYVHFKLKFNNLVIYFPTYQKFRNNTELERGAAIARHTTNSEVRSEKKYGERQLKR